MTFQNNPIRWELLDELESKAESQTSRNISPNSQSIPSRKFNSSPITISSSPTHSHVSEMTPHHTQKGKRHSRSVSREAEPNKRFRSDFNRPQSRNRSATLPHRHSISNLSKDECKQHYYTHSDLHQYSPDLDDPADRPDYDRYDELYSELATQTDRPDRSQNGNRSSPIQQDHGILRSDTRDSSFPAGANANSSGWSPGDLLHRKNGSNSRSNRRVIEVHDTPSPHSTRGLERRAISYSRGPGNVSQLRSGDDTHHNGRPSIGSHNSRVEIFQHIERGDAPRRHDEARGKLSRTRDRSPESFYGHFEGEGEDVSGRDDEMLGSGRRGITANPRQVQHRDEKKGEFEFQSRYVTPRVRLGQSENNRRKESPIRRDKTISYRVIDLVTESDERLGDSRVVRANAQYPPPSPPRTSAFTKPFVKALENVSRRERGISLSPDTQRPLSHNRDSPSSKISPFPAHEKDLRGRAQQPAKESLVTERHNPEIAQQPLRASGNIRRPMIQDGGDDGFAKEHQSSSQRKKERSIAYETPLDKHSKERPPGSSPSLFDTMDIDDGYDTTMEDLLKEKKRAYLMSGVQRSAKVSDSIPSGSIFRKDPRTPPTERRQAEIVNLVSPDATVPSSPVRDVPFIRTVSMKDRIEIAKPPSKLPIHRKAAAPSIVSKPVPKRPAKKEKPKEPTPEPVDRELLRQQRAAQALLSKEVQVEQEALELALFGEVVQPTPEELQAEQERIKAEIRAKREAFLAEAQEREAKKIVAEAEKQRVIAEEKEKQRIQKEQEEERKKIRREAERKKQEAAEELHRETLRKKALEKIEADRKKAAEGAEAKKREDEQAKARAREEAERLAAFRARQDELRKQAVSLNAAKVLPSSDKSDTPAALILVQEEDSDEEEDEDSLFMPWNSPKNSGPINASDVFNKGGGSAALKAYQLERETMEAQKEKERATALRARNDARVKLQREHASVGVSESNASVKLRQATTGQSAEPGAPLRSSQPTQSSPTENPTGNGAYHNSISAPDPTSTSKISESSSINASLSGARSALETARHPVSFDTQKYQQKIQFLSDLQRGRVEKEAKERLHSQKKPSKKGRTEAQKAERRRRDNEKARQRQTEKILNEAKANGVILTSIELSFKVDAYMEKREKDNQRRREKYARTERAANFEPDSLTALLNSSRAATIPKVPALEQLTSSFAEKVDEDLTPEERLRRENELAAREAMEALRQQRGAAFRAAASRKTVADFQDDSESEEDPYDAPSMVPSGGMDLDPDSDDSDDDEQGNGSSAPKPTTNHLFGTSGSSNSEWNQDNEDVDSEEPSSSIVHTQQTPQLPHMPQLPRRPYPAQAIEEEARRPPIPTNVPRSELINVYTVWESQTVSGQKLENMSLKVSVVPDEANNYARARISQARLRDNTSTSEQYRKDGTYFGSVYYDIAEQEGVDVWVSVSPQAREELGHLDLSKLQLIWPKSFFFVIFAVSNEIEYNEDGKTINLDFLKPTLTGPFYDRSEANGEACKILIEYLKPPTARLEFVQQYQEFKQQLKIGLENCNEYDQPFSAEVEKDVDVLAWMKVKKVWVDVEEKNNPQPANWGTGSVQFA